MPNDGLRLLDPALYARGGPPHELFAELRRDAPVSRWEIDRVEPFWAITKHADICAISKRPGSFLRAPGITLAPAERTEIPGFSQMRVVISMDPPEHRKVRKGAHFARRSMAAILRELVSRIESWELAGEPRWIKASFVVGLKQLPVRYQLAG